MLFNRIKNHKGFNTLSFSLIILLYFSTDMVMAGESENLLTEISYNTIQAERLELVFSFTENISQQTPSR